MFTIFDVTVCVIILFTTLMSFIRGGTRDLLSLSSWVGASFATIYFYPYIYSQLETQFDSSIVASISAIAASFVGSLVVFSIIGAIIAASILGSHLGIVDRIFGIIVGAVKGLFIVAVIHSGIMIVSSGEPDWLRSGETYQLTHASAEVVSDITKMFISDEDLAVADGKAQDTRVKFVNMFKDAKQSISRGLNVAKDSIKQLNNVQMDSLEKNFLDGKTAIENKVSQPK